MMMVDSAESQDTAVAVEDIDMVLAAVRMVGPELVSARLTFEVRRRTSGSVRPLLIRLEISTRPGRVVMMMRHRLLLRDEENNVDVG